MKNLLAEKKKKLVILILCLIWTKKMLNLNYLNWKLKAFDEQQKPFLPTLKNLFNLKQLWVVYYVEFRKAARKIIRLDGIFTKSVSKDGCQHLRVTIWMQPSRKTSLSLENLFGHIFKVVDRFCYTCYLLVQSVCYLSNLTHAFLETLTDTPLDTISKDRLTI